ncbi:DsbA family protein [Carnobacterium sp.]|uniref:DsbA family protein n=1 Tax=Carnobacterium sp. TaxID=48221 RepID=UPI00388E4A24
MFSTTHTKNESTHNEMIEIYLFINPIDSSCLQAEKEVMQFVEKSTGKISVHFIPIHNLSTVTQYLATNNLSKSDLTLRNAVCSVTYDICLYYSAAKMQGKKKGRNFLLELQDALIEQKKSFSEALVLEAAKKAKLDIQMFLEDKELEFTKTSFEADQKVAREMNAFNAPSCVLFSDHHKDHGFLIEEGITVELLQALHNPNPLIVEARNQMISKNGIRSINKASLQVL